MSPFFQRLLPRFTAPVVLALGATLPCSAQEPSPAPAQEPDSFWGRFEQAVKAGKWWLSLRYRLENVDQEGIEHEAWASTLRTVLGWESAPWHDASIVLEFEDVAVVGNEEYNSTTNGKVDYAVVVDPEGSEVNQIHLKYAPREEATFKLGRQVIILDNSRFVGDVIWRQNQQTYDAASALWKPVEHLDVFYAFVENVNRVFGDDSPQGDHRMASSLLNAGYQLAGLGRLTAYAYLLDYDSVDELSTNTVGGRFAGSHAFNGTELLYTAEFAAQSDSGDNPNEVDQDYVLGELGARMGGFTLKVGHETLGGSGDPGDAFQTPLALLHGFNGWADKFLTTPDTGLEDLYVLFGKRLGDFEFAAVWHEFQADSGGQDYGSEFDAILTWALGKKLNGGLKFADYDAEDFATDTTKFWLWLGYAP